MVHPAIEVTVTTVGNHTVEDETTEDGKKYQRAFYEAATTIPGCSRGCWGRSDKYPDMVIHFIGMSEICNLDRVLFSNSWNKTMIPAKSMMFIRLSSMDQHRQSS